MALAFDEKEYSPSEMAKVLSEEYGHKVTPSVIRKWDNEVFSKVFGKKRDEKEARNYKMEDLINFNAVAVLRNMGYSLGDVTRILGQLVPEAINKKSSTLTSESTTTTGSERIISELRNKLSRQRNGLDHFALFIQMIKT